MYNKVIFIGNLTRDVELKHTPSGTAIATIGLASNRRYKKQDGSVAEEPCFIDVKVFGRTAEIVNQYTTKGNKILVEGRLVYETWTDQHGNKKSRHIISAESIKLMDFKNEAQELEEEAKMQKPNTKTNAKAKSKSTEEDDLIPFSEIEKNANVKAKTNAEASSVEIEEMEEIPF